MSGLSETHLFISSSPFSHLISIKLSDTEREKRESIHAATMPFPLISYRIPPPLSNLFLPKGTTILPSRRWRRRCSPATGEEAAQFEIDPRKARESLEKLDRQLQSLVDQESLPDKKRPPSPLPGPNVDRDVITGMKRSDEMPEIQGSYLTYSAVFLLILTIFNNIVFNVFIKPSVDGVEQATTFERIPLIEPTINGN